MLTESRHPNKVTVTAAAYQRQLREQKRTTLSPTVKDGLGTMYCFLQRYLALSV